MKRSVFRGLISSMISSKTKAAENLDTIIGRGQADDFMIEKMTNVWVKQSKL